MTAESIAADHFFNDLANHGRQDVDASTVVILQDACYSHRYAKPSAKKTASSLAASARRATSA